MELIQVSHNEMAALFPRPSHIYNTVPFAELNAHKCQEVAYLTFRDTRLRGGLILGIGNGEARSPFSAPFGGLLLNRPQSIGAIEEIYTLAASFAAEKGLAMQVTLPPPFIGTDTYAKSVNVLSRLSRGNTTVELNYHVDLRDITDPQDLYSRSAREKLHQAQKHNFVFQQLPVTPENIARVYDVIHRNRIHRGFPHRMTLQEIIATSAIVPMDLFLLTLDGEPAAAAQVHLLTSSGSSLPAVAQVVYWGDIPQTQFARPMNLLPLCIYRHYLADTSVRILDIGHSTEDGIPNRGLCDYKESIGCISSPKPTFRITPTQKV